MVPLFEGSLLHQQAVEEADTEMVHWKMLGPMATLWPLEPQDIVEWQWEELLFGQLVLHH